MGNCCATIPEEYDQCRSCKKPFLKKTLDLRDGQCGRCARAAGQLYVHVGQIPLRMRQLVWERDFGRQITGQCYACAAVIKRTAFDCGHVQSTYDGGQITVDNLRPVCRTCNRSSGTMNLDEFKRRLGRA
jgi:5-methylcytosine-specific restriction endonuclease McrA